MAGGFTYSSGSTGAPMPTVPGGYTILEDHGIVEANPETGPQATVKFKVLDAADRYSFVQQLLGLWKGTPPSSIIYQAPAAYPPSPNLLCTAIPSIEGFDKPKMLSVGAPWLFNKSAIVTAVFTRPPWQAATNQGYFSIDFNAGGEFYTVPGTTYQFADGTPTMTPVGLLVPQAQITVTRFRMPFLPDQQAIPLLGQVNNAPFQIGWNVYNTGTLLFAGLATQVESDPLGNITFRASYIFQYRSQPWNYEYYPARNGSTGFASVTDYSGNTKYQGGDFFLLP